jgi:hypothetical protein
MRSWVVGIKAGLFAITIFRIICPNRLAFDSLDFLSPLLSTLNVGLLDLRRDANILVAVGAMTASIATTVSSTLVEQLCHHRISCLGVDIHFPVAL